MNDINEKLDVIIDLLKKIIENQTKEVTTRSFNMDKFPSAWNVSYKPYNKNDEL